MAIKEKFTTSEWETLQFAPLWVHTTVGLIDGKIDSKETDILADELHKASFWKNDLARELLNSVAENIDTVMQSYIDDPRGVREGISEVANILTQKVDPETAMGFKKALFVIATYTAKASGGWQGAKWTGTNISPEEKKAIQFICETLGVSESELDKDI